MGIYLETCNLKKIFDTPRGPLHAVDGINLRISAHSTLGVVGESGCGKSTLGRLVLRLIEPTSGKIFVDSQEFTGRSRTGMRQTRTKMQIIFQDPYASLNPRMTVFELIADPLVVNRRILGITTHDVSTRVYELMQRVGLDERFCNTYPHELDGGRRQRIGIARALALNPKFIVCDEPVSALDVSIQAQILNLMMDLQDELGLTYLFITHNLSVVKHISNEIMVMYLGNCVEHADRETLFRNPLHPYTKALLDAIPIPDVRMKNVKPELISGEVTSPIRPKPGCRFYNRCKFASSRCQEPVPLIEVETGHKVACVLHG